MLLPPEPSYKADSGRRSAASLPSHSFLYISGPGPGEQPQQVTAQGGERGRHFLTPGECQGPVAAVEQKPVIWAGGGWGARHLCFQCWQLPSPALAEAPPTAGSLLWGPGPHP